jgi:glycosyltransferase involved in cell wall biosynthesis
MSRGSARLSVNRPGVGTKRLRDLLRRRLERLKVSYGKRKDRLYDRLSGIKTAGHAALLPRKRSVLFVGYAEAALGIGESFRYLLSALDAAELSFSIYPFSRNVETRLIGPFLEHRYDRTAAYDITVAYMAADQFPYCVKDLSLQFAGSGYTILQTFWELPRAPEAWAPLLEKVDELWVPNTFVAEAFRRIFKGTITTIPTCVHVSKPDENNIRENVGLEKDRFYFLYSFDYYSGSARKNPLGLILTFAYAFRIPETKVGLIIKTTGPGELDPTVFQLLESIACVDNRIKVLSRLMVRDQMTALLDACDCYVSLHRSEGFGLGMAEAMALGKPVVGTDFSGNQEFLTEETGFPVPYALRPLMRGEYPMGEGEIWAEPDLEAAIERMRSVFEDQRESRARARRGADIIAARYSPEAVARIVDKRLREIRRARSFAEPADPVNLAYPPK